MMENRLTREGLFIQMASLMALRGTCGRLQVGAIATNENRVIATGYNGPLKDEHHCTSLVCDINTECKRAIHAEANLIAFCAKTGIALEGCTIFCTHQPCQKCAELIIASGIIEVNYLNSYRLTEGLELLLKHNLIVNKIDDQGNPQFI